MCHLPNNSKAVTATEKSAPVTNKNRKPKDVSSKKISHAVTTTETSEPVTNKNRKPEDVSSQKNSHVSDEGN